MATREAAVIAAVCKNKDVHAILAESPDIFGPYGDVFSFIKNYYFKHKGVPDETIIYEKFGEIDLPETTSPTKYYMDELRNAYVKARMEEIMIKAGGALNSMAPGEVLSKLMTSLSKLGQYTFNMHDLSLIDIDSAEEYFKQLKEFSENNNGLPGISTGFDSIDSAYTTGMAPGHSIVLFGYTGKMKSFWSGLLGVNAWLQDRKVMVISLEMSPEEYRERIYAMMGRGQFSISSLSRGDVNPDDFRTWASAKFKDASDFIVVSNQGTSKITPNYIQAKIDTHKPDIVILDYLQLMSDNAMTAQMTQKMMNLSREIKLMAVANNIPIVSISSVTDDDNDKRDAPPLLSQIAWSSAIEYDANLAIAVHAYDDGPIPTVEVAGRKNRHGPLFNCYFKADVDKGIWEETFFTGDM
jgi:replicative DNA helicase